MVGKAKTGSSPATTPKNSILNYFKKTPQPQAATSAQSPSTSQAAKPSVEPPKTPTGDGNRKAANDTPKTPANSSLKKRATSESPDDLSTPKRVKIESPKPQQTSPTAKDFVEGDLVWAKLETWPWWPAMLRGEKKVGDPFKSNTGSRFHVQFFDDPPSRAWIKKINIIPYHGKVQKGDIIPAKGDADWNAACKKGEAALSLTPVQRIEKYWVEFPENVEEEEEDEEEESGQNNKKRDLVAKFITSTISSPSKRKRLRRVKPIIESSDEDETPVNNGSKPKTEVDDEYVPSKEETTAESEHDISAEAESSDIEEVIEESDEDDSSVTPRSSKKSTKTSAAAPSKLTPSSSKAKVNGKGIGKILNFSIDDDSPRPSPSAAFSNAPSSPSPNNTPIETGNWPHLKYTWLQPDQIRDASKRKLNDPDYDPKTLFVPKDFLDNLTPATRQWWEMKAKHYDTILFFKLGKFYELYNTDAVTAVQELGLNFMKGETAHCGFPEIGYSHYSSILVQNGHKVARIEQTETPDMMNERLKKKFRPTKFEKVVKREICQVSTKGIKIPSIQDSSVNPFLPGAEYLFAIMEKTQFNALSEYGVCFIDTTVGTFFIGQFADDRNCSRLRTLFSHYTPVQILYEKNRISSNLQDLFRNLGSGVRVEALVPESEFWSGSKVLKCLAEGSYFAKKGEPFDSVLDWPDNLHNLLCKNDSLGLTPDQSWTMGLSCLGAVVWYLKQCLVEHDILSLKRFETYTPVDLVSSSQDRGSVQSSSSSDNSCKTDSSIPKNKFQVLDGITLRNLGILDGPSSLLSVLDKCSTSFGKRHLRQWLCTPLAVPNEISQRLDAIDDLQSNPDIQELVQPLMKKLQKVDLERLLMKVHTLGSLHRAQDHPDSRAFMFDDKIYSKRRIENLILVLKSFKLCRDIHKELQSITKGKLSSTILLKLVSDFPDLTEHFEYFDEAFDHDEAAKVGKIIPAKGVNPEYDEAMSTIASITSEANKYLQRMESQLQTRATYFGSDKKRFQIEVPDKVRVPGKFEISSQKKGYKRYVSADTKEFLTKLLAAEVDRDNALKDTTRKIFEQFDEHRDKWSKAVSVISTLDVLLSLSSFSCSDNMVRPKVTYSSEPFQIIENGRHPCVSQDTYIPNDTIFGSDSKGNFILLTGPNMGGKSTLMRQIGVITVLAHMGCYVPATRCEMSVVDRIFTRLGANDNIGEGESTFFVELSETSSILRHSTPHSLVLVDELGRGTATYDGTSIAYAVACKLAERKCRTIFSTHYHTLVESVQHLPSVQSAHMACMVENENEDDPTEETITFLYKIAPGPCPKSYGFNAAKLAGIPKDIIRLAYKKAKELESNVNKVDCFRKLGSNIQNNLCSLDKHVNL